MVAGGGQLQPHSIVSTLDGGLTVVAVGRTLGLFSTATRQCVHRLRGHSGAVTGVTAHPIHNNQVISVSTDGTLKIWDTSEGTLVSDTALGEPLLALVAPQGSKQIYVQQQVSGAEKASNAVKLRLFSLETHEVEETPYSFKKATSMAASAEGQYIGLIKGNHLFLWSVETGLRTPLKLVTSKQITCLAIDARASRVAVGDVNGRIHIWHGLRTALAESKAGHTARQPGCTTIHWHSHPVSCLAFTQDSSYLLSGGIEAVLVIWDLSTGAKKFLPRLQGQLLGLFPHLGDPGKVLASLDDNRVLLLNIAAMQADSLMTGLAAQHSELSHSWHVQDCTLLAPGTSILVVARQAAELQFYDILQDKHLYDLQVSLSNVHRRELHDQHGNVIPKIQTLEISYDSKIIATVDQRPDIGRSFVATLKLWRLVPSTDQASRCPYSLRAIIENPHRARISAIAFHPSQHLLATCGADGQARLWAPSNSDTAGQEGWHCQARTSFEGRALHSLTFVPDGSSIALGVDEDVLIWDFFNGRIICKLPVPAVRAFHFHKILPICGTAYLAGMDCNAVVIWDMLTAAVAWWSPVRVASYAVDQSGSGCLAMGVICDGHANACTGFVALFHASSPQPIQVWELPGTVAASLHFGPRQSQQLTGSRNIPSAAAGASLLILTADQTFTVVKVPGKDVLPPDQKSTAEEEAFVPLDLFQEQRKAQSIEAAAGMPAEAVLTQYAGTPTHWLQLPTMLSDDICEALLCSESQVLAL